MKTSIDILKSWFQTGDKPTENQFENLIDSFHHKDDGNIITNYEVSKNGDIIFTFSDGNITKIEKFVLPNTMPLNFIDDLISILNSKVDKVTGKQLSDENFSLELKQKLETLENYIHPELHQITEVDGLQEAIESKVDKIEGKQLSDENFSSEEKTKLADLENYVAPDSKPITYIEELEDTLTKINQDLDSKVEIVEGKQLSDENFTSLEKEKLANFSINAFSGVTDGEDTILANGQGDQITFEGAEIDTENNKVIINQIKNVSELNNDANYAISGDPLKNGTLFQITPSQIGFRVTKTGAIKINVPKEIQVNTLSLYLDISTGYHGADRISANMIINTYIYSNQDSGTNFHTESTRIIASDKKYDFNVRFEQGENPAIYIGELDTDFRYANVAITKITGQYNGILEDALLKRIQDEFVIELTDTFGTINTTLSNNLVQGKSDDSKVDKIEGKQLSSNDFTDAEKEKLAKINTSGFKTISDGTNTFSATKVEDQISFKGATINPENNSISIDNSESIFPEFNLSWGDKSRNFTKNYNNDSTKSYTGNVNLLECEFTNGAKNFLDYEPKILLYRYKSKKKLRYYDEVEKSGKVYSKKAGFYHYFSKGTRNTVIEIKDKKSVLDFGLEHFFSASTTPIAGRLKAQGMKNSVSNTLYRKKSRSQAHFYIKLKLQLNYKGETITSPFSETLRVFIDQNEKYKISYERT
ncbi:hypothetical protein [uncultured Tenacibaculum sp.]|uniref:hypothetical protein n=1 Tax=uncultured Tenacibaculum sp. TaxID=174713 RepID=UPI00262A866E|nr:hypothetical protein [uncultured Tenacibaculum sp.]